jgi:hypothetical protein
MGSTFGDSGGQARGPSGKYSGAGNTGKSDVRSTNIADGPGGLGRDPTISKPRQTAVRAKKISQVTDVNLTWEQRALLLLSQLEVAKGFEDLQPKLRKEVRKLIEDAPGSARL